MSIYCMAPRPSKGRGALTRPRGHAKLVLCTEEDFFLLNFGFNGLKSSK